MDLTSKAIKFVIPIAALWHIVGFAFGIVYIKSSIMSLLGYENYNKKWSFIIKNADFHLWLSGLLLIAAGLFQGNSLEYISNPKLWCKITVILVWVLATQLMHRIGIPQLQLGNKAPMMQLSAINLGCWIYGAFLGCAKPLAYGIVSYPTFLIGFVGTISGCFLALQHLEKRMSHQ